MMVIITCCFQIFVCYLSFAVCCLSFAVCCLRFVICCLLFAICCLLFAICYLLFAICYFTRNQDSMNSYLFFILHTRVCYIKICMNKVLARNRLLQSYTYKPIASNYCCRLNWSNLPPIDSNEWDS